MGEQLEESEKELGIDELQTENNEEVNKESTESNVKNELLSKKDNIYEHTEVEINNKECNDEKQIEDNMNKVFGKLDSRFQMFDSQKISEEKPEVIQNQEQNEKKTVNSFDDVLRN